MKEKLKQRRADRINRAGVAPRPGVDRYPCGQIVHSQRKTKETPEEILNTVLNQPHRKGERSHLVESPLGRLFLFKRITQEQYDDAMRWTYLAINYSIIMGFPPQNMGSPSFEMVARGISIVPEEDEDRVAQVRRDYSDALDKLVDAASVHRGILAAMRAICQPRDEHERLGPLDRATVRNFKLGANALGRLWR